MSAGGSGPGLAGPGFETGVRAGRQPALDSGPGLGPGVGRDGARRGRPVVVAVAGGGDYDLTQANPTVVATPRKPCEESYAVADLCRSRPVP